MAVPVVFRMALIVFTGDRDERGNRLARPLSKAPCINDILPLQPLPLLLPHGLQNRLIIDLAITLTVAGIDRQCSSPPTILHQT